MICRLILIFFVFSSRAHSFEIPADLLSPNRIAKELRLNLVTKLAQMKQNFIQRSIPNGITFTSSNEIVCPLGIRIQKDQNLLKLISLQTSKKDENNQIVSTDKRFYTGCEGKLSFYEKIVFTGPKEILASKKEIYAGSLNLKINQDFKSMVYIMEDGQSKEVLRIMTSKDSDSFSSTVYLNNQKFLLIKGKLKNKTKIYQYHFNYFDLILALTSIEFVILIYLAVSIKDYIFPFKLECWHNYLLFVRLYSNCFSATFKASSPNSSSSNS